MAKYESNSEVMYQDLLKRFNETRRLNIKLLEEKRELLLRIQSGNCADARPVNVNDGFASSFDIVSRDILKVFSYTYLFYAGLPRFKMHFQRLFRLQNTQHLRSFSYVERKFSE